MQAGVHVPGGGAAGRGAAQPAPGLQQTLHHLGRGQPPHHAARLRQVGGIVSVIRIIVIRILVFRISVIVIVIGCLEQFGLGFAALNMFVGFSSL